jgi:SPP1 gp7 family putative phage head morphogenesis protein
LPLLDRVPLVKRLLTGDLSLGTGDSPAESKGIVQMPAHLFWGMGGPADSAKGEGETPRGLSAYAVAALAFMCMRYRATKIVEPAAYVARETEDGDEWIRDHGLAELLEQPNPDEDFGQLLERTQLYRDATGGAIWVKNRDRLGRVASLYAFSRDEYTVEAATVDLPGGGTERRVYGRYTVQTASGPRHLGPDDVLHFREALDVAPLDVALSHLRIGETLKERIRATVRNAALVGGVFSTPADRPSLDDVEFARLKAEIATQFQGTRSGRPMLAEGGLAYTRTAFSLAELELGELWREVEATVCGVFQVHPAIVGAIVGLENSPWSHMETAHALFYDVFAFPTWQGIGRVLTRGLLREARSDPRDLFVRFDTSKVRALQKDGEKRAREAKLAADIWTVDERRIHTGQEPLPNGEGERIAAPARAAPGVQADPAGKTGTGRAEQKGAGTVDPLDLRWATFDAVARGQEAGYLLAAAAQLDTDRAAIVRAVRDAVGRKGVERKMDDDDLRDARAAVDEYLGGTSSAGWRTAAEPLLSSTGRVAVESAAAELGLSFDLLQPGLAKYVERETAWLVRQIADTTRTEVRAALSAGYEAGDDVPALAKRLESLGAFKRSRAELIARTETTRAFNGAGNEALREYAVDSGDRVTKTWLSARDRRVRAPHKPGRLDGEKRGIDEAFSNGRQHPDEPNCRCTLIYAIEETE